MKAIVAVDEKWGIGKNNDLLFSLPEDMKFFRATTLGTTVVMGVNTLKSFPGGKPLPKRVNVVLDSASENHEGCVTVASLDELFDYLKTAAGEVFVIGGAMTYHTLLPYCNEALVTKVKADGEATVFFDNLDKTDGWQCVEESAPTVTNGYEITFTRYVNGNVTNYFKESKE